jgi:XTP/dITP diphosphohydrolase
MKIVLATRNAGKLIEIRKMLAGVNVDIISLEEAGIFEDASEDQNTFAGNALKKAHFAVKKTGLAAVADDSGLCIAALGGAPGVLSARWAGESASSEELITHTLKQVKDVPEGKRRAYFESAVAYVSPNGEEKVFTGRVDGKIGLKERGQALPKLPYDLIFIPDGYDKTFSEMDESEKNKISHRGQAFKKLREFLESNK